MTTTYPGQYHQRAPRSCFTIWPKVYEARLLQPYVVVDHFISKALGLNQLSTRS